MHRGQTARPADRVRRIFLAALTVFSLLAADQAMARRGKGGMPHGVQMLPPAAAEPAAAAQPKPILHSRRHGSKPRGAGR